MNYAVDGSSDEEEDDNASDTFRPIQASKGRGRAVKRRRTSVKSDNDDIYTTNAEAEDDVVEEGNWPYTKLFIFIQRR